jgi:hypothetical protein
MKGFKNNNGNVKPLRPASSEKPEDAKAELFRLRDEIARLAEKDPAKAAKLLSEWIHSNSSKTSATPRKKAG